MSVREFGRKVRVLTAKFEPGFVLGAIDVRCDGAAEVAYANVHGHAYTSFILPGEVVS